jgi:hypothetical protein
MENESKYSYNENNELVENPVYVRLIEYTLISLFIGVFFYILTVITVFLISAIHLLITGKGLVGIIAIPLNIGGITASIAFVIQGVVDLME